MGVRVLAGDRIAALYCSTSMWAFGPVFHDGDNGESAEDRALRFLRWLPQDARHYKDSELSSLYGKFLLLVEPEQPAPASRSIERRVAAQKGGGE